MKPKRKRSGPYAGDHRFRYRRSEHSGMHKEVCKPCRKPENDGNYPLFACLREKNSDIGYRTCRDARLGRNKQVTQSEHQNISLYHGQEAGRSGFRKIFDIRCEFLIHEIKLPYRTRQNVNLSARTTRIWQPVLNLNNDAC